jgi:hypothetical protein
MHAQENGEGNQPKLNFSPVGSAIGVCKDVSGCQRETGRVNCRILIGSTTLQELQLSAGRDMNRDLRSGN